MNQGEAIQIGASPRSITVRPTGTVVLSLRTNCAYQITAEWIGADGEARVGAPTVTAAAGMGHLTAQALQPTATSAELKSGISVVCLEGRAVSRGGNDITPDNAILIELALQLPVGAPGDAVTFTLRLKN